MGTIPESVVEATWRRVDALDEDEALAFGQKAIRRQPELVAYTLVAFEELDPDAQELGHYIFLVVLEMFESAARRRLPIVKRGRIARHDEENLALLEGLAGAHERIFERVVQVQATRQPHVLRYVTSALMEPDPKSEVPELTEEDSGMIFLTLRTVIDALDETLTKVERR